MKNKFFFNLVGMIILLIGCSSIPQDITETPNPTIVFPTPVDTIAPDENLPSGPVTLTVWLPPDFDPNNGSEAGTLLKERLDEFSDRTPGVRVAFRIKDLDGQSSLLESLSAAYEAAPSALPDLVALPGVQMQFAASRNLIYPLESFSSGQEDEDWYDFARDLGRYQGERYGIPFAGDALVMAFHPMIIGDPPGSWEEVILNENVLAFPAADPNAYYTLALYQSLGGEFLDENGDPQLDPVLLESVLNFYLQAKNTEVMPDWLTQNNTDELSWGVFMKNQAQMAITWTTRFFDQTTGGINFTAIPTQDGTPFTIATGWVWSLTGKDQSRYQAAIDLSEYLTEGEFLGEWTLAAGYLPPRPSAIDVWPSGSDLALASKILPSAVLIPDQSIYNVLGELFSQATIKVLNQESTPAEAVDDILSYLGE
jgi:ABC-type glycerol-3-phosphate transport system substrate-binding protein